MKTMAAQCSQAAAHNKEEEGEQEQVGEPHGYYHHHLPQHDHEHQDDDDGDDSAPSPASSIGSSASAMSTSSDVDDAMSVASSSSSSSSRKRRLSASSSEASSDWIYPPPATTRRKTMDTGLDNYRFPVATHRPSYDPELQRRFHLAVSTADSAEVLRLLRAHAATARIDVNRYDEDGRTALQASCALGQLGLAMALVEHGADARLRTREGWSVLHVAAFCGNPELTSYLLRLNTSSNKNSR